METGYLKTCVELEARHLDSLIMISGIDLQVVLTQCPVNFYSQTGGDNNRYAVIIPLHDPPDLSDLLLLEAAGHSRCVMPGQACIVMKDIDHIDYITRHMTPDRRMANNKTATYMIITFNDTLLDKMVREIGHCAAPPLHRRVLLPDAELWRLVLNLVMAIRHGRQGYREMACTSGSQIVLWAVRASQHDRQNPQPETVKRDVCLRVLHVYNQMLTHFSSKMTLAQMAQMAGMSQTTYMRRFIDVFGSSPGRVQMQIRLEKAKRLLLHSSARISDISLQCGFLSASRFIAVFKREAAITPARFRQTYTGRVRLTLQHGQEASTGAVQKPDS